MQKPSYLHGLLFLALIGVFSGYSLSGAQKSSPEVAGGTLNIARNTGTVDLIGKWAFWPGKFIDPSITIGDFKRFEQFPASWSVYEGEKLSANGYGSYAVHITGLDPTVLYAFNFPGYSCASRYFANGKEIYSEGVPSNNRVGEIPEWDTDVVPLSEAGLTEVTLVLHLSNYNDIYPASPLTVQIGSFDVLSAARSHKRNLMIIPFGAILAMGAYFIALYVFHHQEYSSLWLGILCIDFALRIICYDEFLVQDILPFFPTALMFRLGYLTFSLSLAAFAGFIRSLYPEHTYKPLIIAIMVGAMGYAVCNLFTPVMFFVSLQVPFQLFTLASALYLISVVILAVLGRKPGSLFFFAGFCFFFLIVIRDIMIANRLVEGVFLAHYGILGIIAAMALIVVSHFTRAFNAVEAATDELAKINTSLVRFVPNEFLQFLGKSSITEVYLGDNILKDMCVMFIHLGMDIQLQGSASRLNMLEMFNNTLHKVNPVIQRYHGFVDKYLAEGLMVLFPDDSCNAVRCAVEIQSVIDQYNAEREADKLPHINFAVGLHRGSLMLGTIGESERMDSTVISDVVNIASRLLKFALSKNSSIIISEQVSINREFLASCKISLLPHGEVRLKGREAPIAVYEVRPL